MSLYKIISKYVAKLLKYIILFKDLLTFLGIDYGYASFIILYLIVIWNSILKIRWIGKF